MSTQDYQLRLENLLLNPYSWQLHGSAQMAAGQVAWAAPAT